MLLRLIRDAQGEVNTITFDLDFDPRRESRVLCMRAPTAMEQHRRRGREACRRSGLGVAARAARKSERASAQKGDGDAGGRKRGGGHEPRNKNSVSGIGRSRRLAEAIRSKSKRGAT